MIHKTWTGLISILLGVIFILSPLGGVRAIGILSGAILIVIGLWMLINALRERYYRRIAFLWFVIALLLLLVGFLLASQILLISVLTGVWLYLTGILFIMAGLTVALFGWDIYFMRTMGFISVLLGILYCIIGFLAFNPVYLGIMIGIVLILSGILIIRI